MVNIVPLFLMHNFRKLSTFCVELELGSYLSSFKKAPFYCFIRIIIQLLTGAFMHLLCFQWNSLYLKLFQTPWISRFSLLARYIHWMLIEFFHLTRYLCNWLPVISDSRRPSASGVMVSLNTPSLVHQNYSLQTDLSYKFFLSSNIARNNS